MRIGIHTVRETHFPSDKAMLTTHSQGKLLGGIVGTEIVRYDVYGVDVITANKMESNGENGRVTVSETTKKLLEENYPECFEFEFKQEVYVKQATNPHINAYLLSSERDEIENSQIHSSQ